MKKIQSVAILMYREMSLLNICLSQFILQDATLSPELPLGQSGFETLDKTGHSIPGEFFITKSVLALCVPL